MSDIKSMQYIKTLEQIAWGISEGEILSAADISTDLGPRKLRRLMFIQAKNIVKKINK